MTRRHSGFTLLELILAMAGASLLMLVAGTFAVDVLRYNRSLSDQIDAEQAARLALKQFSREARTANSSSLGAYAIESATTTSVVFFANIDSDSLVERVRYFLSGTNLQRGVVKPSGSPLIYNLATEKITTLTKNVTNADIFSYYDQNYTGSEAPLTSPLTVTSIRVIKFRTVIDQNVKTSPVGLELVTEVTLRNLKSN